MMRYMILIAGSLLFAAAVAQPERGPRTQPGTEMGIYTPEQHELYDGRFTWSAVAFIRPAR